MFFSLKEGALITVTHLNHIIIFCREVVFYWRSLEMLFTSKQDFMISAAWKRMNECREKRLYEQEIELTTVFYMDNYQRKTCCLPISWGWSWLISYVWSVWEEQHSSCVFVYTCLHAACVYVEGKWKVKAGKFPQRRTRPPHHFSHPSSPENWYSCWGIISL